MSAHTSPTANQMAGILAKSDVALADKTGVAIYLVNNGFDSGEVCANITNAIDAARYKRNHERTKSFVSLLFRAGRA